MNRCTRTNEDWSRVLGDWVRRGKTAGRRPEMGALSTTAVRLLAALVDEVEIRSAFSPPTVVRTKDLAAPGPPNPYVRAVKPTIILRGPGLDGPLVVAPGGEASPDEWRWNLVKVGIAVALVGAGTGAVAFGLGAAYGRRRSRR